MTHVYPPAQPLNRLSIRTPLIYAACLLLFSLIQASPAASAGEEHEPLAEKIFINADSMKMNIETGSSVYTGNVKITQGELVLTGDTVTILQKNDLVERIVVVGQPASYIHVTESGDPIHATSKKMIYIASRNRLTLIDDAKLTQPEHTVKSQRIVYDTNLRTVVAGVAAPGSKKTTLATPEHERVNITLTPKPAVENKVEKRSDSNTGH